MAVSDWSANAALNTSVDGINIAEQCAAGNMNAMGRAIMANVRVMYDNLPVVSTLVTKTGGVFTGNPTFSGRGGYAHHNDPANTSGRIFIQATGGSAPSGMANGDFLYLVAP